MVIFDTKKWLLESMKFPYLKAKKILHMSDQWVCLAPEILVDFFFEKKQLPLFPKAHQATILG